MDTDLMSKRISVSWLLANNINPIVGDEVCLTGSDEKMKIDSSKKLAAVIDDAFNYSVISFAWRCGYKERPLPQNTYCLAHFDNNPHYGHSLKNKSSEFDWDEVKHYKPCMVELFDLFVLDMGLQPTNEKSREMLASIIEMRSYLRQVKRQLETRARENYNRSKTKQPGYVLPEQYKALAEHFEAEALKVKKWIATLGQLS